jgi:CubicO group peptidase (beta-lactamase class C family)
VSRPFLPTTSALLLAACAGSAPAGGDGASSSSASPERAALIARIDSIVNTPIASGKVAGASVAVVKGQDTILIKGYGKADLEFDVATPQGAIYEIGSVTKQFTAVGIMLLAEQGKLSLDDDITKYFPGYNSQGNRIPVRRLLDHTSGIKGYTELPEFGRIGMTDAPQDTLVGIFSRKPFDFKTGEEEIYNNSAYFLAGLLIEKLSGKSYADFVKETMFDKAGMTNSRYCSESAIVKNRAHGYDAADTMGTLIRARYLNHKWPYAAGSLCSTVRDLVKWNHALHNGQILQPASYAELIRPSTLNDGTTLRYAKGLALVPLAGRRAIWHDGGINGFISLNRWLPDDTLSVVVLWNSTGDGLDVGEPIIEAVLGKPADDTKPIEGDINEFSGTWKGVGRGRPTEAVLTVEGAVLTLKAGPGKPDTLHYVGNDTFRHGGTLISFDRVGGKPARLRMDAGYGYYILKKS